MQHDKNVEAINRDKRLKWAPVVSGSLVKKGVKKWISMDKKHMELRQKVRYNIAIDLIRWLLTQKLSQNK